MFDNLDKLENGDKFYIKILNNLLEYEVTKTQVVLPTNTESLIIQDNKDLVTLVTCTPKHVNSHRLLVTGTRVVNSTPSNQIEIKSIKKFNFLWLYGFIFFIIFFVFILNKLKSSKQ